MTYLIVEIIFYLLAALVIGFAAGWFIHQIRSSSGVSTIDQESLSRIEVAEALREKMRAERDDLSVKVRDIETKLDESEARRELQTAEIASLKIEMSGLNDKDTAINKYRSEADSLRQQLRTAMETSANYRSQLELKAKETADYRLQAEKAHQQIQKIEKQVAQRTKSLGLNFEGHEALSGSDEMIAELEGLLAERDIEIGDLHKLLDEVRAEADSMREQTEISRSQLHALEVQVKDWQEARSTRKGRRHRASANTPDEISIDKPGVTQVEKALRKELADRTRKYVVLQADYKQLQERYSFLESASESETPDTEQSTDELEDYRPEFLMTSASREPDDLKVIFGIGPVIESTLNELGIYYYEQIAKLSDPDIRWLASQIDSFPKRIKQDNWVGQATALSDEQDRKSDSP